MVVQGTRFIIVTAQVTVPLAVVSPNPTEALIEAQRTFAYRFGEAVSAIEFQHLEFSEEFYNSGAVTKAEAAPPLRSGVQ